MGMCLCETHGRQPMRLCCPHIKPGDPGTAITMIGGAVRLLACPACVRTFVVDGEVPESREEDFSAILHSWCVKCWDAAARGEPTSWVP